MKSALRATAVLSGSSAVSILVSLASTKVLALVLHPEGYGYYGLLQSFVTVTSLLAGMGMATGIVRLGAEAAKEGNEAALADLRAGAWLLFVILGIAAVALIALFRLPLSRWAMGSPDHQGAVLIAAIALLFTVAVNLQTGMLNAWHRVDALAAYGVVSSVLAAATNILAVVLWRADGIVPAVVAGAAATWLASRWFLHRYVQRTSMRASWSHALRSARALLDFGIPFTASAAVGTGVQLAMPIVVLHLLSTEAVAYYKAAAAISVSYLGFLVTAMGQDYYPRISAVRQQPDVMLHLIHDQYRLVLLLAAPLILATLALAPYLVPLVYSARFTPAAEILEWQLIGDIFKFTSWTLSFAVLARCQPIAYFCTELAGGLLTLGTSYLGARWFGLSGLGIGFVATYALYYGVVRTFLHHEIGFIETVPNLRLLLLALAAALFVRILPATNLLRYRTAIALALAVSFGCYSARILWHEHTTDISLRSKKLVTN